MKKILLGSLGVLNLALYLTALCLWVVLPDQLTLNMATTAFSLALTFVLLFKQRDRIGLYVVSSHFKNLVSTLISSLLILGILGLVNYLAFKHPWQKDLSLEQINSLTEQSKKVVEQLKGPVSIEVFARKEQGLPLVKFLERYRAHNPEVQIRLVDPDLDPSAVRRYQIGKYGTVVVSYQGKWVAISEVSELSITNALVKVGRNKDPLVYFLTGHEEMDLDEVRQNGLSNLKGLLESSFFKVKEVNLTSAGQIPQEVDAVVLWGPQTSLSSQELNVLGEYLNRGGRALVGFMPEFNTPKLETLREFFAGYGLKVHNNLVFDVQSHVNGSKGSVPLISEYNHHHLITKEFSGQTFFPFSVSIEKNVATENKYHVTYLAQTGSQTTSYAKYNFTQVGKGSWGRDEKLDRPGPHALAAASEELDPPVNRRPQKVVAFGNSTFVANSYFGQGRNFELFLNALSWLVEEGQLISLDRPRATPQRIVMSTPHRNALMYFSILFGPLLLLLAAMWRYRQRSRL